MTHDEIITRLLEADRTIRTVGFDDGPFERGSTAPVHVAGAVCAGTRFEGMVYGRVRQDGLDATETIIELLEGGKFLPQLHALVVDGVALAGFNVVDVPRVAESLDLPVLTVMRDRPDFEALDEALQHVSEPRKRRRIIDRAGPIYEGDSMFFQTAGLSAEIGRRLLAAITDRGHVPEPVRIAHLVASAVVTGQSGRRA